MGPCVQMPSLETVIVGDLLESRSFDEYYYSYNIGIIRAGEWR